MHIAGEEEDFSAKKGTGWQKNCKNFATARSKFIDVTIVTNDRFFLYLRMYSRVQ